MRRRSPSPPRFRRQRRLPRLKGWLGPALVLALVAAWWWGLRPIIDEQGWVTVTDPVSVCGDERRTPICAVDGDTLVVGSGPQRRRVRLTGYDAPELDGACEAERIRARDARAALAKWLNRDPFEWDGADDPPRDQYGRELRAVRRTSRDGAREYLSDIMIGRGLAGESGWGTEAVDWCD